MTKARKDYKANTYGEKRISISISRGEFFLKNEINLKISIHEGLGMPDDIIYLKTHAAALADKVELVKIRKKMEVKLLKLISEKPDKNNQITYEYTLFELTPPPQ
jgi:hypothetical protein